MKSGLDRAPPLPRLVLGIVATGVVGAMPNTRLRGRAADRENRPAGSNWTAWRRSPPTRWTVHARRSGPPTRPGRGRVDDAGERPDRDPFGAARPALALGLVLGSWSSACCWASTVPVVVRCRSRYRPDAPARPSAGQLDELLQMMAGSLRAGDSLPQAVATICRRRGIRYHGVRARDQRGPGRPFHDGVAGRRASACATRTSTGSPRPSASTVKSAVTSPTSLGNVARLSASARR